MNWHKTLYEIYDKLEANGLVDVSESLQNEQMKGGTGGEILSLMLSAVTALKHNRPEVYTVIQKEGDELIAFGKSIGYI